jgi:hypothetical protein
MFARVVSWLIVRLSGTVELAAIWRRISDEIELRGELALAGQRSPHQWPRGLLYAAEMTTRALASPALTKLLAYILLLDALKRRFRSEAKRSKLSSAKQHLLEHVKTLPHKATE